MSDISLSGCRERRFVSLVRVVSQLCAVLGHLHELLRGKPNGLRGKGKAVHENSIGSILENQRPCSSSKLAIQGEHRNQRLAGKSVLVLPTSTNMIIVLIP